MVLSFYPLVGAFAWIGILLICGVIIRSKVKFFQTLLLPSSLIGGLLGFVLMQFGLIGMPSPEGWKIIPTSMFSLITFHLFAFNFVGIGFIKPEGEMNGKSLMKGAVWIALILNICFAVQALLGFSVFAIWDTLSADNIRAELGFLLAAGFTQGPGQAQAYGAIWQEKFNIGAAIDVGLSFAAIGFLLAGLVGIPLSNYLIKKGATAHKSTDGLSLEFITGIMPKDNTVTYAKETTHNANINSIGFHLALMLAAYGFTYILALAILTYTPSAIASMAFGMFFFLGLLVAQLIRKIITTLKADYMLDNGTTKAMTSACVDLLICSVFMGINTANVMPFIAPLVLSVIIATLGTAFICFYLRKKLPEFGAERAMVAFGYATGTGANGLLLLRVIDPKFQTPVLHELGLVVVVQSFIALPFYVLGAVPTLGIPLSIGVLGALFIASLAAVYMLNVGKIRKT